MAKITKQEFENWSKDFDKKFETIIDIDIADGKITTEAEKNQAQEFRSLFKVHTKEGNLFAIASFVGGFFENIPESKRTKIFSDTDGLTLEQWKEKIERRLKEHVEVSGYYKPNQSVDLPSLKARWGKLVDLIKNKEYEKLILHLSKEDYRDITMLDLFLSEGNRIIGESNDYKKSPLVEKFPFLAEDLCGKVEAAQKKLEQSEQNNNDRERERERERDNSHRPTIPNSPKQNNSQIEELKRQKQELETKNQELERQLSSQSLSEVEKKLKEAELAANRKLLAEKDEELSKLQKQKPNQPTNTEKDNLNWAIGLGIVALVVGLLCLIVLLRKKKD